MSVKRDRETSNAEESAVAASKRARMEPAPAPAPAPVPAEAAFLERIVVLGGRYETSDEDAIKYWDPARCEDPAVRALLAKELSKPEPPYELMLYLILRDSEDDELVELKIDPLVRNCPYEQLGMCEFKRAHVVTLDF